MKNPVRKTICGLGSGKYLGGCGSRVEHTRALLLQSRAQLFKASLA